jgi:predicted alpha-1,2-mannosidase
MKNKWLLISSYFIILHFGVFAIKPIDLVNPLQGTNSSYELSAGNTYPAIGLPWGMNFWTPQTKENGNGWQYVYKDTLIRGFKQTHQPSPWINDYGCFSLFPTTTTKIFASEQRGSVFLHENEIVRPNYYSVLFHQENIKTEFAASNSGVIFRFTYDDLKKAFLIIDGFPGQGSMELSADKKVITGKSSWNMSGKAEKLPDNFATHFVIAFDSEVEEFGSYVDTLCQKNLYRVDGRNVGMYVKFKLSKKTPITVRVASSFISIEQAQVNWNREVGQKSFDDVNISGRNTWNTLLERISVEGGDLDKQKTFYTGLYRTMLFPRKIHEKDKDGKIIHYSPLSGKIENGLFYTDNGFWDTFRAVHPFFTLMFPTMSNEIMQSLVNFYDEGGWLPEWCSPGYRDCMIGQNSTSLIADAYLKGIRNFDVEKAFEAMEKGANDVGYIKSLGRDGFDYYNKYGYIPYNAGITESVSKTLEYAYNDYCIYLMAVALNKDKSKINLYKKRALNYRNVFDKSINFVRPKDENGQWLSEFKEDAWGGAFTEGSSWHWTFTAMHDPKGLIDLMGGKKKFSMKLDALFDSEPTFDFTHYGYIIHEMREMVLCKMGQYAHGNQPIQHAIYLYNYVGEPYKTQKRVREVLEKLYNSSPAGLCGDEDNGQTSAWFVFSALGFYPVCPGSCEYIIGSPLFQKSSLLLESGKRFTVVAENNSKENVYIQSATLNGCKFNKSYITHQQIINGGELKFIMGNKPNYNWAAESFPYSLSKQK